MDQTKSPYDIDGFHFNPDMYLQKIFKEKGLREIMDEEAAIVRDTKGLHSSMQTLVYENYNKFISATDTIKKMKSDFKKMETEMDLLGRNMDSITSFSDGISNTLQDTRQNISKLSGIHALLKKLQFLFKLPAKLKSLLDENKYDEAVDDYLKTRKILDHYSHLESFVGIQQECSDIVGQLKGRLYERLNGQRASAKELTESVCLLIRMGESRESLREAFIEVSTERLKSHVNRLETDDTIEDLRELVDAAGNGFLSDLCLLVNSYNAMFVGFEECHNAGGYLRDLIDSRMLELLSALSFRLCREQNDSVVLVGALDHLYSKLNCLNHLFDSDKYSKKGMEIVVNAAKSQCVAKRTSLEEQFADWVRSLRQSIAQDAEQAPDLLATLVMNIVEKVKSMLNRLTDFTQPELNFSSDPTFKKRFVEECVRRDLVGQFLEHVAESCLKLTKPPPGTSGPALPALLVLASMCSQFHSTHVSYLMGLVDEWFNPQGTSNSDVNATESTRQYQNDLCQAHLSAAHALSNHYVHQQGALISQMIKKSMDVRAWSSDFEPRKVRPVVLRVLEELAAAENCVGALFIEGERRTQAGSGSRHHHRSIVTATSVWSPGSTVGGYTHNLSKLFSDKIEIYAPVALTKVSILTGVIKIGLKTLLESVRLKTFSKFGMQQIQVDVHYLQLHLWRYVADENLVQLLLDEILTSATHRCIQPVLMEPSIVEIICGN